MVAGVICYAQLLAATRIVSGIEAKQIVKINIFKRSAFESTVQMTSCEKPILPSNRLLISPKAHFGLALFHLPRAR